MSKSVRHEDLVARALGALSESERVRVDAALATDAEARQAFESIAAHLLRYDHLPPAPPAPPFARLEAVLDEGIAKDDVESARPDLRILELQDARPVTRGARWAAVASLAAAAVLLIALWASWRGDAPVDGPTVVAGPGLELWRNGAELPLPARAARHVEPGDVLRCRKPAEAELAERVRLVLDAGAALRIVARDASTVHLEGGRAWFEVRPGAFLVETPYGPVRVLGTAFEVDLRAGRLEVAVAHGRVAAGGDEIPAGARLGTDGVRPSTAAAGAWFNRPELTVEIAGGAEVAEGTEAATLARGTPLRLRLVFHNPGQVPIRLRGPGAVRTAVWLGFEAATDGAPSRRVHEFPVFPVNVVAGTALLEPGATAELAAGASRALTIEIVPPLRSPGAYRCRALYRPEGQPAVLSAPLELEVR